MMALGLVTRSSAKSLVNTFERIQRNTHHLEASQLVSTFVGSSSVARRARMIKILDRRFTMEGVLPTELEYRIEWQDGNGSHG